MKTTAMPRSRIRSTSSSTLPVWMTPSAAVAVVDPYHTLVRRHDPGQDLDERGLARPVVPDERGDLTRERLERRAAQGPHVTEVLHDAVGAGHRYVGHRPATSRQGTPRP